MTESAPKIPPDQLRQAVRDQYAAVAADPTQPFHFSTGRELARMLGYEDALLAGIPAGAIESFAGVGNPFQIAPLSAGEVVVDIGSGAGMDALIAARMVAPGGRVIGIDTTPQMVEKAIRNARQAGAANAEFLEGRAESAPLPDESADVVISNGVLNLCLDKHAAFAEAYRILRPGGRLQIADVLLDKPVPASQRDLIYLWTECVAGGLPRTEYLHIVRTAGFRGVEIVGEFDTFSGAEGEAAAARYGARGFNLRAFKP